MPPPARPPMRLHEFPPELIVNIFTWGARLSKQFCITLSLVCTWTRTIALPYLYRTVILRDQKALDEFHHCLNVSQLKLAPFVKNLYIGAYRFHVSCLSLIGACKNIKHLATTHLALFTLDNSPYTGQLSGNSIEHGQISLTLLDADSPMHIRNMAVSSRHPILKHVTHVHFSRPSSWPISSHPFPFPRLTHLAITLDWLAAVVPDGIRDVVQQHPSLEMILIIFPEDILDAFAKNEGLEWFWERRENDPRMFLLEMPLRVPEDWEDEANGEPDLWTRGERFTLEQIEVRARGTTGLPST